MTDALTSDHVEYVTAGPFSCLCVCVYLGTPSSVRILGCNRPTDTCEGAELERRRDGFCAAARKAAVVVSRDKAAEDATPTLDCEGALTDSTHDHVVERSPVEQLGLVAAPYKRVAAPGA